MRAYTIQYHLFKGIFRFRYQQLKWWFYHILIGKHCSCLWKCCGGWGTGKEKYVDWSSLCSLFCNLQNERKKSENTRILNQGWNMMVSSVLSNRIAHVLCTGGGGGGRSIKKNWYGCAAGNFHYHPIAEPQTNQICNPYIKPNFWSINFSTNLAIFCNKSLY